MHNLNTYNWSKSITQRIYSTSRSRTPCLFNGGLGRSGHPFIRWREHGRRYSNDCKSPARNSTVPWLVFDEHATIMEFHIPATPLDGPFTIQALQSLQSVYNHKIIENIFRQPWVSVYRISPHVAWHVISPQQRPQLGKTRCLRWHRVVPLHCLQTKAKVLWRQCYRTKGFCSMSQWGLYVHQRYVHKLIFLIVKVHLRKSI